ncbi:carotenoid oxygenase family protein [Paraburkholderia guartelaensis]|uniref:carotenoid oxygenase family protein n=1 Tax=Paraburkholderia TaxID=1822464 RepID=UPI0038BCD614
MAYFHEPVFVPCTEKAAEGGWIVTVMCNREKEISEFAVFDALDVSHGPLPRSSFRVASHMAFTAAGSRSKKSLCQNDLKNLKNPSGQQPKSGLQSAFF